MTTPRVVNNNAPAVSRPAQSVQELQEQVWRNGASQSDGAKARFIRAQTIGTSQTAIAHGLGKVPQGCFVMPQVDARVWRSAAPDGKLVYLTASASVVVDILVVP